MIRSRCLHLREKKTNCPCSKEGRKNFEHNDKFIYEYLYGAGPVMAQRSVSKNESFTKSYTRLKSKVFSLEILILLIWTNVPKTNVALTNVVVIVVVCCICSQDPLFKV